MKTLIIEMDYPDEVSLKEAKDYAQEALERWGGQKFPGDEEDEADPLFYTTKAPVGRMKLKA